MSSTPAAAAAPLLPRSPSLPGRTASLACAKRSAPLTTPPGLVDTAYANIDDDCAPALPATLQPGEALTCRFTATVSGAAGGVYSSRVTAVAIDDDGYPLGGTATVQVAVVSGRVYLPVVVR